MLIIMALQPNASRHLISGEWTLCSLSARNNAPIEPGAAVNPLHVPVIISGYQLMLIEFIQTVYLIKYVFNESKNTKCFDAMIGKAIINKFMYVCIFAINIRLG